MQGRTFDLAVRGAGSTDTLRVKPVSVFRVAWLRDSTFRVTVANASALVNPGSFARYHPVEWEFVRRASGGTPFGVGIEGEASCRYRVIFRQKGAGPIDLSEIAREYDVVPELSNPDAISALAPEGAGLSLSRAAKSLSEVRIRVTLKKKGGAETIRSDWVPVPACQYPTPPPPLAAASDVVRIESFIAEVCEVDCGGMRVTVSASVTNTGSRRVRCEDMTWDLMYGQIKAASETGFTVEVDPGTTSGFPVVLRAQRRSGKFAVLVSKGQCSYL